MIRLESLTDEGEAREVARLLAQHLERTGSPRARQLLADWPLTQSQFQVVAPHPAEARPAEQPVHEPEKASAQPVSEAKPVARGGF